MSQPYNPRTVIEKTPNPLLQRFLSQYKALSDLDWSTLAENDSQPILDRLSALEPNHRHYVAVRWRQVHALADSTGTAVLSKVSGGCGLHIADCLAAMRNGYERAFWCLVEHPWLFDHEQVYAYTYGLPRTSRETRVGFPAGRLAVTETFIENLRAQIKEVYRQEERAQLCRLDHRQHDGLHVFHAYPSDYVDELDSYGEDGQLTTVTVMPPFHIVYHLNESAGSVGLMAKGGADKHEELFNRFSTVAYGAPPPVRAAKKTFDLRVLKDHNHEFPRKHGDHIALVRVTALRLQFPESTHHKAWFEVDRDNPGDSLYDMLQEKLQGGLREFAKTRILSAELQAIFRRPHDSEKIVNFKITAPRWCDLEDDDAEGRVLWEYLPAWGLEVTSSHVG